MWGASEPRKRLLEFSWSSSFLAQSVPRSLPNCCFTQQGQAAEKLSHYIAPSALPQCRTGIYPRPRVPASAYKQNKKSLPVTTE